MGCMQSTELSVPNLFQRNLCVHHKVPATDVYKVLCELGKGAFGIVEKVEHLKTKKHYAMKTVTFDTGHKRHEFEKEMDILRGLHHPNIVRMVETYEDDHRFFIIMELAAGGTVWLATGSVLVFLISLCSCWCLLAARQSEAARYALPEREPLQGP